MGFKKKKTIKDEDLIIEDMLDLSFDDDFDIPDNAANIDTEIAKVKKRFTIGRVFAVLVKFIFQTLLVLLISALVLAVGMIYIIEKGPSPEIKELFVVTVMQSSAAKPLAKLFLEEEEVERIMEENSVSYDDTEYDDSLVVIDDNSGSEDIIIEDVHGSTYNGKMMIISDPSRVYVYSIPNYYGQHGMTVPEMCQADNAIAGINGGGFVDDYTYGVGSMPIGITISKGKWLVGDMGSYYNLVGFDSSNKLIVGSMTGYQAMSYGIRDALWWGPALVINGTPVNVGNGGGLNPRTAIGQRADGAVLLLTVDGRQPSSLGASYADLVSIMVEYGAVNAANLDGGNSTSMVYEGEVISNPAALTGERYKPTAFLVKR